MMQDVMSQLATVTVTYNPDLGVLKRQLDSIPSDCVKIIVDNASQNHDALKILAESDTLIKLFLNQENLGLAEAINRGVAFAATIAGVNYVLLLDQDSEPVCGAVEHLFGVLHDLEKKIGFCVVGPRMMDAVTGLHHGFHVMTRWRWRRVYPSIGDAPIECANVNGSGILTSLETWKKGGGMDSELFIDHVDTDWSFRMLSKSFPLFGIPGADFRHSMGLGSRKIWIFGWHLLPIRSPLRHYYLYRNTLRLLQRNYVPAVWKVWAVAKMLLTLPMVLLMGPERTKQLSAIIRGLRDV